MKTYRYFLIAIAALAVLAGRALAQDEYTDQEGDDEGCQHYNTFDCPENSHFFDIGLGVNQYKINLHVDCVICRNPQNVIVFGGDCHQECEGFRPGEQAAFADALAAASAFDARKLLALSPRLAGRVTFNAMRRSIQILNCKGNYVVATVPVPADILSRAQALPDVDRAIVTFRADANEHHVGQEASIMDPLIVPALLGLGVIPVIRRRRTR